MGSQLAKDLAGSELLTLEQQLHYHLRSNFYPPIPSSMLTPCLEAIEAYFDEQVEKLIDLPEGVSYRGEEQATAGAIITGHRLEAWLDND
jgi:hypothetical protein